MQIKQIVTAVTVLVLASAASAQDTRKPYIIELADAPAAAYTGGVAGLKATKPAPGKRLMVSATDVQAYTAYLNNKQAAVAATVPAARITYRYKNIFNGFAAWLTDAELTKLMATPGVRAVTFDTPRRPDTTYTPKFIGISEPGGAWSRTDASGRAVKGEGVIVANVDSGVWPEDPSFSDKVDANGVPVSSHLPGTVVYGPLPAGRYTGTCQAGEGFTAAMCNNKLVGAQYFNETWKLAESLGLVATWPLEYVDSPRDEDGHGSHTLSTAGGNENVTTVVNGVTVTGMSGIAPRARLAAYKVCYTDLAAGARGQGGCYPSDSVAAIDKAVADGVDVINFSISGSQTSFRDAVEVAFFNAAAAGVFVSASAGNTAGNNVAHISPWITTVGNSTHDRFTVSTVTQGNGATYGGPSFQTAGLPSTPLIHARDAGVAGANPTNLALCFGPADGPTTLLDPAKVAGKVVICERGSNVLVNKSANAKTAGAAGMLLLNTPTSADTVFNIAHSVPTVHVTAANYAVVTAYLAATPAPTIAFSGAVQQAGVVAPVMNDTSSHGPNKADNSVLKPDITAPGTDIIAAYTNASINAAQRAQIIAGTLIPDAAADMISGTSMSSPHVAGAAALLKQANPTWSPFAIKSALMTSAVQTVKLPNGAVDADRWGFGAGHLSPSLALDTKVVYDQSIFDHVNYYNGALSGRDLNLASLTHPNVVGVGTLTRTLSNLGSVPVTYAASASLAGYAVTVAPASLTLAPGASANYTVTMQRTTAPIEGWVFGEVNWTSATAPTLRSPLTAKASELVAAAQMADTRNAGSKVITVATGYTGSLLLSPTGLVPATVAPGTVNTNQRVCLPFTVPTGAKRVRAQLFDSETGGGAASDLDLVILRGNTTVGSSGSITSEELVTLVSPIAGTNYRACVDGYAPLGGSASFKLNLWVLGPSHPGTLRAAGPSRVTTGGTASVAASWNVPAGQRYLGLVEYRSVAAGAVIGSTNIFIDNVPAPAVATSVSVSRIKPAN